jgi:hypothetical protein
VSDERLIELLEEPDREPMREAIGLDAEPQISREDFMGPTEDIESPDDYIEFLGVALPRRDERAGDTEPETAAQLEAEDGEEGAPGGDTEQLPDVPAVDEAMEEDASESEDEVTRPSRRGRARLVPTARPARQRGRAIGRRVPKISPRPSARDESSMEGEDRG